MRRRSHVVCIRQQGPARSGQNRTGLTLNCTTNISSRCRSPATHCENTFPCRPVPVREPPCRCLREESASETETCFLAFTMYVCIRSWDAYCLVKARRCLDHRRRRDKRDKSILAREIGASRCFDEPVRPACVLFAISWTTRHRRRRRPMHVLPGVGVLVL